MQQCGQQPEYTTAAVGAERVGRSSREPLRDLNGRLAPELATPTKGCFFGLLTSPASSCKAGGVALKPPRHVGATTPPTSHHRRRLSLAAQFKANDRPQGAEVHGDNADFGESGRTHSCRRKSKFSSDGSTYRGEIEDASSQLVLVGSLRAAHTAGKSSNKSWLPSSALAGGASSSAGPASSCGSTSGLLFAASPSEEASTGWWNGRGSLVLEQRLPRSFSSRSSPADGSNSPLSILRRKAAASFKFKLFPGRNREFWRSCGGGAGTEGSPLGRPSAGSDRGLTLNDPRRSSILPLHLAGSTNCTKNPIFSDGFATSPCRRSSGAADDQGGFDATPYSAGMSISWREGLVGRVLEMDGMSCFYCCCLSREGNVGHWFGGGAGYGTHGRRRLVERHGGKGKVHEVFSPTKWLCPCSESITDGNGVIISSRSEWTIFCRNDLFEL